VLIEVPVKCMHTPAETVKLAAIEEAARLLAGLIAGLSGYADKKAKEQAKSEKANSINNGEDEKPAGASGAGLEGFFCNWLA